MEAVRARRPGAPGFALRRRHAAALAVPSALILLAACLRFWALGRQGFWYDEATTAWLLRGTPAELLRRLPHTESTPPLYYLLAWVWVHVFGDSEVGLRSLSAVAGATAVPVTFLAARALAGRRVAVMAGLLVAVNPMLVWYSQEARAYSLLVLASALSLWLLARARAEPTLGRLAAWGVTAAAALCTHYFALFVVLPEAALLLADRRPAIRWRLLALCVPGIAGAALAALAHAQSGRVYHFRGIPLGVRLEQVAQFSAVGFSPPSSLRVLAVAAAAIVAAVCSLAIRGGSDERRAAIVAAIVAGGALLVPTLLARLGSDYLNARNVIGAIVPLAVVVAAGLGASRAKRVGAVLASVLVGISLWMVAAVPRDVYAQRPHWQQVARALAQPGAPRAILLLGASTWSRPLGFYLGRTWWPPPAGRPVSEIEVLRKLPHVGFCPTGVWWGALCNIGAHARLERSPAPGFSFVSTERVAGFAIDRYRARRPIRLYAERPVERRTNRVQHPRKRVLMVTQVPAPRLP